jgi:hypothetical protein
MVSQGTSLGKPGARACVWDIYGGGVFGSCVWARLIGVALCVAPLLSGWARLIDVLFCVYVCLC